MTPKLTDEMREALGRRPGRPVRVEDEQTRQVYFLVSSEDLGRLVDETLREALRIGLDQSDRGESREWDADAFLAEARERRGKPA